MRGAPHWWVDMRFDSRPHGVEFGFACSLCDAVPGRTWLEVKTDIKDETIRSGDEFCGRCVANLVRALVWLERNNMVHGDLSENNIIVNESETDSEPAHYVIDIDGFVAADAGDSLCTLSVNEGGTKGTAGHHPPDLENAENPAPNSDRFGRDMLLLELLCFQSDSADQAVAWIGDLVVVRLYYVVAQSFNPSTAYSLNTPLLLQSLKLDELRSIRKVY